jgi:hypothetical protein
MTSYDETPWWCQLLWPWSGPRSYAQIKDPDAWLDGVGRQFARRAGELASDLAGDDPPGEGYLAKAGRLTAARRQAEEIIRQEYGPLASDGKDDGDEEDKRPRPGNGGDLLGEDPADARRVQGVGLGVQRLADGGGTGVPDPDMPGRRRAGCRGPGQLGPGRARLAERRDRHGEGLRKAGHQPEPRRMVLGGHLALACAARRPGRGRAGRHRAVAGLNEKEIVVAHPQIVSWGCVIRPAVCNNP